MQLHIIIDDHAMDLEVPEAYLRENTATFERLDQGMSQGVQFGREWLDDPNGLQRCQIAANKLLAAIDSHNEGLALMAAGYILSRRPETAQVNIDNNGEPWETRFD